jgi:chromosome segregation ATPase
MNRAAEVLAEWDARVAGHGRRTPGEARRDTDLEKAEKKLKAKTAESAELRKRLDAAATVIAALHHDNQALREHLNSRCAPVTGLDERRAHRIPGQGPATGPC